MPGPTPRRRRLPTAPAAAPGPAAALTPALEAALRDLGLVGLGPVALPLLAALALGEPVLLVGAHGTAKTTLCKRLARALGARVVRVYDASKAFLEDVLGFPIPQSLAEGEVRYAPTPISIGPAEAVLVDELSRAPPAMQSKWLEVVRGRTIMGLPLPNLRFVFAAMNPLGYEGTFALDAALAGRFAAVVVLPEAQELTDAERLAIIRARAEDDAPALATAGAPDHDGRALRGLLDAARARLAAPDEAETEALAAYANAFGRWLERGDAPLDGRRLGMLHRLAGAALAVARELLGAPLPLAQAGPVLLAAARGGVPSAAVGRDARAPLVRAAHEVALAGALGRTLTHPLPLDPRRLVPALAAAPADLPREVAQEAITRLIADARREDLDPEARSAALVGLAALARALTRGEVRLPADDQQRALEAFAAALEWPSSLGPEELVDLVTDAGGVVEAAVGPPRPQTCLRLALRAHAPASPHAAPPWLEDPQATARLAATLDHDLRDALARAAASTPGAPA